MHLREPETPGSQAEARTSSSRTFVGQNLLLRLSDNWKTFYEFLKWDLYGSIRSPSPSDSHCDATNEKSGDLKSSSFSTFCLGNSQALTPTAINVNRTQLKRVKYPNSFLNPSWIIMLPHQITASSYKCFLWRITYPDPPYTQALWLLPWITTAHINLMARSVDW